MVFAWLCIDFTITVKPKLLTCLCKSALQQKGTYLPGLINTNMLILKLNNESKYQLTKMIMILLPKQKIVTIYNDGMITLKCECCEKITNIHWYELLLDHLLVSIFKKFYGKDWRIGYLKALNLIVDNRLLGKEYSKHPIYTVFTEFFIPWESNLISMPKTDLNH